MIFSYFTQINTLRGIVRTADDKHTPGFYIFWVLISHISSGFKNATWTTNKTATVFGKQKPAWQFKTAAATFYKFAFLEKRSKRSQTLSWLSHGLKYTPANQIFIIAWKHISIHILCVNVSWEGNNGSFLFVCVKTCSFSSLETIVYTLCNYYIVLHLLQLHPKLFTYELYLILLLITTDVETSSW